MRILFISRYEGLSFNINYFYEDLKSKIWEKRNPKCLMLICLSMAIAYPDIYIW